MIQWRIWRKLILPNCATKQYVGYIEHDYIVAWFGKIYGIHFASNIFPPIRMELNPSRQLLIYVSTLQGLVLVHGYWCMCRQYKVYR